MKPMEENLWPMKRAHTLSTLSSNPFRDPAMRTSWTPWARTYVTENVHIIATEWYLVESLKWWHVYRSSTCRMWIDRKEAGEPHMSIWIRNVELVLGFSMTMLATMATEACGQNQNWKGSGQATVPWFWERGWVVDLLYSLLQSEYGQGYGHVFGGGHA